MTAALQNITRQDWRAWARGLIGSVVKGTASAGFSFLSTNAASAAGFDVPALNWKTGVAVLVSAAALHLFDYLRTKPVPTGDEVNESANETPTT